MNLKILLPFKVYADIQGVQRLVVETRSGSFGVLPHRLDCVMALVPGILTYEVADGSDVYVAVDVGGLVKAGQEVLVSVRNAIAGRDLGLLREAVERDFLAVDEQETVVTAMLARMEGDLIQRLTGLRHGR